MERAYDGIILADKAEGQTSYDMVRSIGRILGVKKIGHAGTLDPFASGLLIVLLGQGTKLSPYLMAEDKRYIATLRLGIETDTYDPTGHMIKKNPVPPLDWDTIAETARSFHGEIEQTPPPYSAVKVKGRRAYSLARKGIKVSLPKRRVRIEGIKILSVDLPDIRMEIDCSKGTYIRSLAVDIGRALGTGAHVKALKRISSGPFDVRQAVRLDHPADTLLPCIQDHFLTLRKALPHLGEAFVDHDMAHKIRNGYHPRQEEISVPFEDGDSEHGAIKLIADRHLIAIAERVDMKGNNRDRIRILRVFT